MEVAWTTILIIALLLPGVFFFIGLSTGHRYSREIIKTSAIGEVGWAVFISIIIHLLAWRVLILFGFDLANDLKQIADFETMPRWLLVDHIVRWLFPFGFYILITALVGLGVGWLFSLLGHLGYLPFLITHKWINQVRLSMKAGLVTTYVMTNTVENNKVLMYKGILAEFYQQKEGKFEYVVLKSCSRYFMTFEQATPKTGEQLQLFGSQIGRPEGVWDFLQIEGTNIANILFDPSPQIVETQQGTAALDRALANIDSLIAEFRAQAAAEAAPTTRHNQTETLPTEGSTMQERTDHRPRRRRVTARRPNTPASGMNDKSS